MSNEHQQKYLTTQTFVDFINEHYGLGLTRSRLLRDSMSKDKDGRPRIPIAPEPAAWFGNRALRTEEQAHEYAAKLITPAHRGPHQHEAA